ncbi:MAG TPA: histidine kinase [Streptosporangiaceae bacterium]
MDAQIIQLAAVRRVRGTARRIVTLARSADQPARPTRRQITADAAFALAVAVASLAMMFLSARGSVALEWKHGVLFAVVARAAPLTIRRRRPLTAFGLCLAACLLLADLPGIALASIIALVPAAYSVVTYSRYRSAALPSVAAGVLVLVFLAAAPALSRGGLLQTAVLVFTPVVIAGIVGNAMRLWRQRAGEYRARLARLQAEHEDATHRAVALERSRIAGELHDVVTHNVSMMVVQAGGARRVLAAEPQEATSALLAIEECGRAAITELQHLLGLLTLQDTGLSGMPGGGPPQPQPGLDRLQSLIDKVTGAGVPVELRVSGQARALPPGIDLAAYRVIQEALTNVIKHAGQPRTTVTIEYHHDDLSIEVADEGREAKPTRRPPAVPREAGTTPGRPGGIPGAGRGLLGLRERVSLYGGELTAGRTPGGGWQVRARIPDAAALVTPPAPT